MLGWGGGGYLRSAGRVLRYGQGGDRGKGRSLEYEHISLTAKCFENIKLLCVHSHESGWKISNPTMSILL